MQAVLTHQPCSDLLCPSRDNLAIHEGERGTYVGDATQVEVHNAVEVLHWVGEALQSRAVGSTLLNSDSSRSHLVLTLTVEVGSTVGKLLFVDLAGSEKVKRTGATGSLLTEATAINKSLSALGNVIAALTSNAAAGDAGTPAAVVPFRDSKLTRLLKECLSGSAFTTLIGACVEIPLMSRPRHSLPSPLRSLRVTLRRGCSRHHLITALRCPSQEPAMLARCPHPRCGGHPGCCCGGPDAGHPGARRAD